MSRVFAAVLGATLIAGCGGQDAEISTANADTVATSNALTWTEFLSKVHQLPDQDLFLVNGDTTVEGWKNLHGFYEVAVLGQNKLIIDQVGGVDSKWTDSQKLNLTYCVSNNFGTRKATVVQAMASASAAWAAATNIQYVYVPAEDGNCNISNSAILFDVRLVASTARTWPARSSRETRARPAAWRSTPRLSAARSRA